jgi:CRISPR-associated protein Csb1
VTMNFDDFVQAVSSAVGIRSKTPLEPLGGEGDKIFPPTYANGDHPETKYARETRRIDGQDVECVLLDSVASQANRRELAALAAARAGEVAVPIVSVDFRDTEVSFLDRISSWEAPHRIFDALLRDSLLDGMPFRSSPIGRAITEATHRNAAALLRWSPNTLLFGGWDSTGPKGGRGSKYERGLTAEISGINARFGVKTSSRVDPAGIVKGISVYEAREGDDFDWTIDPDSARQEKGQPVRYKGGGEGGAGRPSQINHGNVAPSIDARAGGVTVDRVEALTVISFPAIRRLAFPADGAGRPLEGERRQRAERAAHAALAALGLAATVFAFDDGFDLRSRCVLAPTGTPTFELRRRDGGSDSFELDRAGARGLLTDAIAALVETGLSWEADEVLLQPSERLVDLVGRSQELARTAPGEAES